MHSICFGDTLGWLVETNPARAATLTVWCHNLGTESRQRECREVPLTGGLTDLLDANCVCEVAAASTGQHPGLLAIGRGSTICPYPSRFSRDLALVVER